MINLQYRKMPSGLPVLSREEIDVLGEALVYDFCPEALKAPQPIDVDMFCEKYLGLNLDYKYLSNCGIYLGMMVFHDTDKVVIYDQEKEEAKYHSVKGGTVIIDNSLLYDPRNEKIPVSASGRIRRRAYDQMMQKKKAIDHRYRFTMGHETAGHAVLHREYFERLRDPSFPIQCRVGSPQKNDVRSFSDVDWMEWQADHMASSFLMPACMVRKCLIDIEDLLKTMWENYRYQYMVLHISKTFNVSMQAASIRLKHLNLIPKNGRV